jgi:hypothetical protein
MHWKELNDTVARALDRFPPPAYRLGPPILELVFLSAQYTIEDPKNHIVLDPN